MNKYLGLVRQSPEMERKRVQQRSRDTSPFNTNLDTEFAAKQHVRSFVLLHIIQQQNVIRCDYICCSLISTRQVYIESTVPCHTFTLATETRSRPIYKLRVTN